MSIALGPIHRSYKEATASRARRVPPAGSDRLKPAKGVMVGLALATGFWAVLASGIAAFWLF